MKTYAGQVRGAGPMLGREVACGRRANDDRGVGCDEETHALAVCWSSRPAPHSLPSDGIEPFRNGWNELRRGQRRTPGRAAAKQTSQARHPRDEA